MAEFKPKECGEIRDKISRWRDYWKYNNDEYNEFTEFVMGGQWKDEEAKVFEDYKKIPLTNNKLGTLMNHLLGEQRQNTPNLQVVAESGVNPEIANIREALVKDISFSSDAKIVYQTAFQQAAIGGFGAYRVGIEYEDEFSFNQEIRFYKIKDPTRCYWDLAAENVCKTDGMFSGFYADMSRDKFKSIYGEELERSIGYVGSEDYNMPFSDDKSIVLINHYSREYNKTKIYLLSNGRILDSKQFKELGKTEIEGKEFLIDNGMPVTIMDERQTAYYKIKHHLIAGDYEIDVSDFPSQQLPLIFVDQNSYWDKKGKQVCRPFFKDAKDSQRYINYLATQSAYILKVSRFDQFLVSKQNVRSPDTQTIWQNPQVMQGGLIYDESPNGNVPQPLRPPELSQSLAAEYARAMGDIQTSTGLYDTQMGQQGNEVSGRAIDARTKRGNYNTFVVFDSLNRAIACGGQIVNEMIPKVYDIERRLTLNMPDRGVQPITINQMDEYGNVIANDIRSGKYQVRLLPGPSFEGQKTEALESLQMVLQANPQLFNMIADLYAENLPLPNNIELKNRLRTIVPEEIIKAGKTGEPLPPKQQEPSPEIIIAQAKLKEVELKEQELMRKQQEMKLENEKDVEELKLKWAELEKERQQAAASLQEGLLRFTAETHRTNTDAEMSHADNLIKLLTHKQTARMPI